MSEPRQRLNRRTLVAGAGTAGALTAAAVVLSTRIEPAAVPVPTTPPPEAQRDAGYRASEHVLRYYQTTRI